MTPEHLAEIKAYYADYAGTHGATVNELIAEVERLQAENARLVTGVAEIEQRWRKVSRDESFLRGHFRRTMEWCADELAALLPMEDRR